MAACNATREWNTPRSWRRLVNVAKNLSTALIHDAEVGVKWKVKRGTPRQPFEHVGVLVRGVVVGSGASADFRSEDNG